MKQFKNVPLDAPTALGASTAFTLKRAGHLLGACFVHIESRGRSVTFSGDLGRPNDLIMNAPAPPPATDLLVCESTYGDRTHPSIDPEAELAECLTPALARGAVVVIPSFAVGRAQNLLLQIARLKRKGQLPDVPVFLDSPMAIDASMLYRRFIDEHRLSASECDEMCRAATFVNTAEQSKALSGRGAPMIIVSASGMATGGRVVHHLKAFAGDDRNLILLAGFQAPGTRGAALVSGASRVRIHGEDWQVRAEVRQLQSSSSHADAGEILAWLKQLPRPPRQIFITHGEPGASDTLRQRIERELGWSAVVPEHRQTVELEAEA